MRPRSSHSTSDPALPVRSAESGRANSGSTRASISRYDEFAICSPARSTIPLPTPQKISTAATIPTIRATRGGQRRAARCADPPAGQREQPREPDQRDERQRGDQPGRPRPDAPDRLDPHQRADRVLPPGGAPQEQRRDPGADDDLGQLDHPQPPPRQGRQPQPRPQPGEQRPEPIARRRARSRQYPLDPGAARQQRRGQREREEQRGHQHADRRERAPQAQQRRPRPRADRGARRTRQVAVC